MTITTYFDDSDDPLWMFSAPGYEDNPFPHPLDRDDLRRADRPPTREQAERWARWIGLDLEGGWTLEVSR